MRDFTKNYDFPEISDGRLGAHPRRCSSVCPLHVPSSLGDRGFCQDSRGWPTGQEAEQVPGAVPRGVPQGHRETMTKRTTMEEEEDVHDEEEDNSRKNPNHVMYKTNNKFRKKSEFSKIFLKMF